MKLDAAKRAAINAMITVRVPASTANLGPAFDCLGLALDLWNETQIEFEGKKLFIEIKGEEVSAIPGDESNLTVRAFLRIHEELGERASSGLHILCAQNIPINGGLGSSAAAIASGLLAANALLGNPMSLETLLQLGAAMEGHADNLAAVLFGGLVLVTEENGRYRAQKLECAQLRAVVVAPDIELRTPESRRALPPKVLMANAVFNIGRSLQVAEALRSGDIAALSVAMQDKLHQPYRLPLIPGAAEAIHAAQQAGAAAAVSGAGPSIIAFVEEGREKAITEVLRAPFAERGVKTRHYLLSSTPAGASIQIDH
ncbi:MAG: homoserine kinase [Anaerolineales bacterium]